MLHVDAHKDADFSEKVCVFLNGINAHLHKECQRFTKGIDMNIGIPQEISIEENRVAVTPAGVYELTREGHKVYLESGCGIKSGFSDHDYQQVGGEIVY